VLSKATNPQLPRMLSNATNAKIASLNSQKDQKAAAKRAASLKTAEKVAGHQSMDKECPMKEYPANDAVEAMGIVDSSPVPSKSTKAKLGKTAAKGPLGTHQLSKVGGKEIALNATQDAALSAAKRASPLKTIEKGANHPAGSKKQKKSPTNDAVEAKGIDDSSLVPTTSTKSKKGMAAPKGPPVMLHSGKTVGKAIASKANAENIHDERKDDPNPIEHVPGENHCFIFIFLLMQLNAKF